MWTAGSEDALNSAEEACRWQLCFTLLFVSRKR